MLTLGNYSLLNRCACLLTTSCETICNPIHFLHRLVPKNIRWEKKINQIIPCFFALHKTPKAFHFILSSLMSHDSCRIIFPLQYHHVEIKTFSQLWKKKEGRGLWKGPIFENSEICLRIKELWDISLDSSDNVHYYSLNIWFEHNF